MNQDIMFNPLIQQALYSNMYMNYMFQQQQMIQHMISQMSDPTIPKLPLKQEFMNTQALGQLPTATNVLDQLPFQERVQTELDQQTIEKLEQVDEESSPRVNGHWTKQEHQLYLQFVRDNEDILRSKYDKKSKKVFKLMSQCIPTRTATQCRSHHQKFNPLSKGRRKQRLLARNLPTIVQ